jgi:hypothetical protein
VDQQQLKSYVDAALALQRFQFDQPITDEITLQFSRVHAIAATFIDIELPVSLESAAVFRP